MKKVLFYILGTVLLLSSCSGNEDGIPANNIANPESSTVLLLKVDYTTNHFEGGKELSFEGISDTFTVTNEYDEPGDFGRLQLYYDELNQKIFDGGIHWMGLGNISFPENFLPPNAFEVAATDDFFVCAGFENVFNPTNGDFDYNPVWNSIQGLVKVREYVNANPSASIKLFLYTPSVGAGNPEEWDWIVLLKK